MKIALTLLLSSVTVLYGQAIIGRPIKPLNATGCSQYTTANTASFDGSDSLSSTANLTGIADSKVVTVSFWFKQATLPTAETVFDMVNGGANRRFRVQLTAAAKVQVDAFDSGGVQILQATSNFVLTTTDWHHCMVAVDLASTSNRGFYVDGSVDAATWGIYIDGQIDFNMSPSPNVAVGVNLVTGSQSWSGDLAEFWIDDVYNNTISDYYCTGRPANLGNNGELPTGSAPTLYLSRAGSGNTWATDSSGNGNTFTIGGTLGSTTSP
jgi:hypothetical protein